MKTVKEAAAYLNLSERRVRVLCETHGLGKKLGTTWAIESKTLAAFRRRNRPAHRPNKK